MHTKPFLILLIFTLLSCTNENKTSLSDDIDATQSVHHALTSYFHTKKPYLECFDSLMWQKEVLLRSYVQGNGYEETYFITMKKHKDLELYDTIRSGTININRAFANVIWYKDNWENQFFHEKYSTLYFSIDRWSGFQIMAIKFDDEDRILLDKSIYGHAYFIIHDSEIECPLLRGLNQGMSENYYYNLNRKKGESITTLNFENDSIFIGWNK